MSAMVLLPAAASASAQLPRNAFHSASIVSLPGSSSCTLYPLPPSATSSATVCAMKALAFASLPLRMSQFMPEPEAAMSGFVLRPSSVAKRRVQLKASAAVEALLICDVKLPSAETK